MRNKGQLKSQLMSTSKLVDASKDVKSFFVHLKAYLDLLHQDEGFIDYFAAVADKEKNSLNKHDIEYSKHTSFWFPWEELETFWKLDNFKYKDFEELNNINTKVRNDGRKEINLIPAVGIELAKEELENIYKLNTDSENIDFKMRDYRQYFETTHLKIMSKLESFVPTLNLRDIKLNENSYDRRSGIVHLTPYDKKAISVNGKVKRPNGEKYLQCRVLECVFKSVNTLRQGTSFSKILGVNVSKINESKVRRIENAVAEINKKVAKDNGPKSLIKILKDRVFLNNSYL